MSESMREEFEVWAKKRNLSLVRYKGGMYVSDCTMWAKIAWTESRAALCVELPVVADYIDLHRQGMNAKVYNEALTEAIHAAGVKTK